MSGGLIESLRWGPGHRASFLEEIYLHDNLVVHNEWSTDGLPISCSFFHDALSCSTLHLAVSVGICVTFHRPGVVFMKSQCSVCRRRTSTGALSVCMRLHHACCACWFSYREELGLHSKTILWHCIRLLFPTVTKYLRLIALWGKDRFWSIVLEVWGHLFASMEDLVADGITIQMFTWITDISWWVQAQE